MWWPRKMLAINQEGREVEKDKGKGAWVDKCHSRKDKWD
jgi:hypothetical protein